MKKIRISQGRRDFLAVLLAVRRVPGLSSRELRGLVKLNSRRTGRALGRLVRAGRVDVVTISRDGRRIDLAFRKGRVPATGAIEAPRRLLAGGGTWKTAYVYGLDCACIGVTGRPCIEWAKVAPFRARVRAVAAAESVRFDLPTKFVDFYLLRYNWLTKSAADDRILLTVSGERAN